MLTVRAPTTLLVSETFPPKISFLRLFWPYFLAFFHVDIEVLQSWYSPLYLLSPIFLLPFVRLERGVIHYS